MNALRPASLLSLLCALAGCGRLRFDDLPSYPVIDGSATFDAGSGPEVALDASLDDGAAPTIHDAEPAPLDGSASDARILELDAQREDASSADAASCTPSRAGAACTGCVRYVDRDSTALLPDGLTWQRAYPDLLQALLVAAAAVESDDTLSECQVWVREGRYDIYQSSSSNTIPLSSSVPLYGGFAGDERDPSERDLKAHPTILDGADAQGKNHVYHLIVSTSGGVVDGFTLTGGRADASSGPHAHGGGLYVAGGTLRARNLSFVDNAAKSAGGAIYGLNTVLSLENCRIENSVADENGGAVAVEGFGSDTSAWLTMRGVDLRGNRAGGHGGALYTSGTVYLRLENLVVADNVAGGGGGGASLVGMGTLSASTFHANTSGSGASGLVFSCIQSCNVLNSIFWDPSNLPELVLSGSVSARYNIVNGGASGIGNSSADPLFVAPSNDLHLRADSPAVDSADGCAGPEQDRDGQPRRDLPGVANSGVAPVFSDRGAYELQTNGTGYAPFAEICRSSTGSGTQKPHDKARAGQNLPGTRRPWPTESDGLPGE